MKREKIEERFLDLIEGSISGEEAKDLRTAIEADAELKRSFEAYSNIIDAESQVRNERYSLHAGFSSKIMEQLADRGNGNYFYMDTVNEAKRVFSEGLFSTMEVVAKDVKLQIEFNPAHVHEYRLVGYDNRVLEKQDFSNDAVDAGEVGAGHTVTAIYEVILADSELASDSPDAYYRYNARPAAATPAQTKFASELAFLRIRYKEPEGSSSKSSEYPIKAKDVRKSVKDTSTDFRFAAAVTYFAQMLRNSQFVGSYSKRDILTLAEGAKGRDENGRRAEFIGLLRRFAEHG